MTSSFYAGVNPNIPGNGGPDCAAFITVTQRVVETCLATLYSGLFIHYGYKQAKWPKRIVCHESEHSQYWRRIFLSVMCLTFGIELGFKFATRQSIFLLNPCHVATLFQVILLVSPATSVFSLMLFRFQMYILPGATLALVFPVVNSRLLPLEALTYFIQHFLMLVVPCLLMAIGGAFTPEPLVDISWPLMSLGVLFVYHFYPLQIISYITQVNLNNMLCPAISDPFRGPYYRLVAVGHQSIFVILHSKLHTYTIRALLRVLRVFPFFAQMEVSYPTHVVNGSVKRGDSCAAGDRVVKVSQNGNGVAHKSRTHQE